MDLNSVLQYAVDQKAADVFIVAGRPLSLRVKNDIIMYNDEPLMPDDTLYLLTQIYSMAHRDISKVEKHGDDDFSFAIAGVSRFRVNAFKQRGSLAAVIRIITFNLPRAEELSIPPYLMELTKANNGIVLVTGPTGSGKSTTLATMIDRINKTQNKHIITLEDPVEYLHKHDKCLVSQREINIDTESYVTALRASLRQSPDVILLGEMRDFDTISVAMTAAETGHLIFSTLHTIGAANTIDRIIDVFPPEQQHQIAVQLSMVLNAVISQQLVPDVHGNIIPVFEIMTCTPAIRNMIRENKIPQIEGQLYSSMKEDMISMDSALLRLYQQGQITAETAVNFATNPEMLSKKVNLGF